MSGHVLVVDDERTLCDVLELNLVRRGLRVSTCTDGEQALGAIARGDVDVVLTDIQMPGIDGLELCRRIAQNRPDLPVVMMTGFGSFESAVAALRAGAYDFVTKPIEFDVLWFTLRRALEHRELREKVRRLDHALADARGFGELIGRSEPMQVMFEQLALIARTDAAVLIAGESGSGKELVARAIHERSARCERPFVAVNCASLPEQLIESELFGHERGAFTGANSPRRGLFVEVGGGTMLLDEIGELPLALQPKLLRALEERRVRPLGADREVEYDARVIAATNRDLELAVEQGRFRADLLFRLDVVRVDVPPLRARDNDVLLLAQQFVERFARQHGKAVRGLSEGAAAKLLDYAWPGNVRELRNAIERAIVLTASERLLVDDLPERVRAWRRAEPLAGATDPSGLAPLEEVERRYILQVLEALGGNRTATSRRLGLDRKTLYRKLLSYGVEAE